MAASRHTSAHALASHMDDAGDMPARQRKPGAAKHLRLNRITVRRAKEADKAAYGPVLAAAMARDDVDQAQLAIATGTDQPQVSRWHSPHAPDAPNLMHGRLALQAGLVNWARAVGVQDAPPVVDEPESVRTARLCKELADVLTVATGNLADGHRDGFERGNERRELLELRSVIDRRLAVLDAEDAAEADARKGLVR